MHAGEGAEDYHRNRQQGGGRYGCRSQGGGADLMLYGDQPGAHNGDEEHRVRGRERRRQLAVGKDGAIIEREYLESDVRRDRQYVDDSECQYFFIHQTEVFTLEELHDSRHGESQRDHESHVAKDLSDDVAGGAGGDVVSEEGVDRSQSDETFFGTYRLYVDSRYEYDEYRE